MPSNSVVGVFQDHSGAVVLTVRLDLPPAAGDNDFLGQIEFACRRALAAQATAFVAVLFADSTVRSRWAVEILAEVVSVAQGGGLLLQGAGYQQAGRWYSVETRGRVVSQARGGDDVAQVQCQWIDRGVSYLPDRESIERNVVGTANELSQAVARVYEIRTAPHDWPTRSIRQRREVEDALFNFVLDDYPSSIRVRHCQFGSDPQWIATVGHAVKDRRVREPFLWRIAEVHGSLDPRTSGRDVVAALCFLVRHIPGQHRAAIASCAAAVAWQMGDGAVSAIAAKHAQECDSSNVLSGLVLGALERGVPPTAWLQTLQAVSLHDLRATRRRRNRSPA